MGAPQYEQAGADIGGTGTTNTIPRWTGPSTLGDSVITQSGTALVTTGSSSATQTTFRVRTVGTANNAPVFSLYREGVNEQVIWAGSGTIRFGFATDPAGYTDAQLLTATKMGIDASGNVGIGTANPTGKFEVYGSAASAASIRATYYGAGNRSIRMFADTVCLLETTTDDDLWLRRNGALVAKVISTGIDVSTSGYGLKLPATPGNADTQTLDCYQENTWTPTIAGFGGTAPTVTDAVYTRIGRLVFARVTISATAAANFSSTWGTTTITAPFTAAKAVPVPISRYNLGAVVGLHDVGTNTVLLPTLALDNTALILAWTFYV